MLTLIKPTDFFIVSYLKQEQHIRNLVLLCTEHITQILLLRCATRFKKFYFIHLPDFPILKYFKKETITSYVDKPAHFSFKNF